MRMITKIACRTIGTAGMGIALYNATRVGSQFSRNEAQRTQAKYLEKAYFNSRTIDDVSYTNNNIRKKTFDLRTRNPLPALWGKIKGWTQGALYSLGNSLPLVACSALALVSKGVLAELGAIGVGAGLCYNIARNGFGLGKQNPMN